jgi:hypothetical protein
MDYQSALFFDLTWILKGTASRALHLFYEKRPKMENGKPKMVISPLAG